MDVVDLLRRGVVEVVVVAGAGEVSVETCHLRSGC